jgi:hypothetical protein
MTDRNASLYNLQNAKQMLTALLPKKREAVRQEETIETAGYVRLASKVSPRAQAQAPLPAVPVSDGSEQAPETSLPTPEKFTAWEDCVAWCMQVMRAEAAFVVDSQGFIIATRGRVPSHGFECTGAELVYSMDQLERIDPEAGKLFWIDLDYDKHRLVGFVTPAEDMEYFIIGLVEPDPSYNSIKHTISRQIIESLPNMN